MKKITTKIKFIGLIMGISILTVITATLMINSKNTQDATVMNIAGKQRMLSQKMTKLVYSLHLQNDTDYAELDKTVKEFEGNLNSLLQGNKTENIYIPPNSHIRKQLERVLATWKEFQRHIETFKNQHGQLEKYKRFFVQNNDQLLALSDSVVKGMVEEGFEQILIDQSGLQRMLSQRMAFQLLFYISTGERVHLEAFHAAYREYDRTLKYFSTPEILDKSRMVKEAVQENIGLWRGYKTNIDLILQHLLDVNDAYVYIRQNNDLLLEETDTVVTLYNLYSEDQRQFLQNFQFTAGIVIIFLIIYVMMIAQGIKDHMDEFLEKSKMLANLDFDPSKEQERLNQMKFDVHGGEEELQEASGHINAFIHKINECARQSGEAQKMSEKIAEEMADITDQMMEYLDELNLDKEEKKKLTQEISKSEDMAIQSSEEIISAAKILENLKKHLDKLQSLKEMQGKTGN